MKFKCKIIFNTLKVHESLQKPFMRQRRLLLKAFMNKFPYTSFSSPPQHFVKTTLQKTFTQHIPLQNSPINIKNPLIICKLPQFPPQKSFSWLNFITSFCGKKLQLIDNNFSFAKHKTSCAWDCAWKVLQVH